MRGERARALAMAAFFTCLGRSTRAAPARATIGPIEVLAHHKHYARHHDPAWPDPFDTPHAACAARDGDAIVVSVQTKLLWIDGSTGDLLRETVPPFVTHECAMAFARRGPESVLVFAGTDRAPHPPESDLTMIVLSRSGAPLFVTRSRSAVEESVIDLAFAGRTLYLHRADAWGRGGPVRSFDLDMLAEKSSYDVTGCMGLYSDGRDVFAIDDRRAAWRLAGTSPTPAPRPGGSLLMEGCADLRAPLPVVAGGGLAAALDYGHAGAPCDERESIQLRDESGRVVARRVVPPGAWRFASTVVPWDDGLRVVAQKSDLVGFQIWKVPVAWATPAGASPTAR